MIPVGDFIRWMEEIAPPSLVCEGDNIGVQIGDPRKKVKYVLVTLEVTPEVITEAGDKNCQLIITHHPLIRSPLKNLAGSETLSSIRQAIRQDLIIYAAHTNLDSAPGGTNDLLAETLRLKNIQPLHITRQESLTKLVVFVPRGQEDKVREAMAEAGAGIIGNYSYCSFQTPGTGSFKASREAHPLIGEIGEMEKVEEYRLEMLVPESKINSVISAMRQVHPYEEVAFDIYTLKNPGRLYGLGRVGDLEREWTLEELVAWVKKALQIKDVRIINSSETSPSAEKINSSLWDKKIHRLAVNAGSGSEVIPQAFYHETQALVTGEIRYHDALLAKLLGLTVIEAGHYATERLVVPVVAEKLQKKINQSGREGQVIVSEISTDPFEFY